MQWAVYSPTFLHPLRSTLHRKGCNKGQRNAWVSLIESLFYFSGAKNVRLRSGRHWLHPVGRLSRCRNSIQCHRSVWKRGGVVSCASLFLVGLPGGVAGAARTNQSAWTPIAIVRRVRVAESFILKDGLVGRGKVEGVRCGEEGGRILPHIYLLRKRVAYVYLGAMSAKSDGSTYALSVQGRPRRYCGDWRFYFSLVHARASMYYVCTYIVSYLFFFTPKFTTVGRSVGNR